MHVHVCVGGVFAYVHVCGGSLYTSEPVHVEIRVCSYLIFSGRASPQYRKSPIKLDCMLLPRTQISSPAPTRSLTIICNSSCKGFSTPLLAAMCTRHVCSILAYA